jgi:hypothetical protein
VTQPTGRSGPGWHNVCRECLGSLVEWPDMRPCECKPTLMTAEGIEAFLAKRKAAISSVMKNVPVRRSHAPPAPADELQRIARLALKLPRPWIDGGVTAKEWCDAVDEIREIANGR